MTGVSPFPVPNLVSTCLSVLLRLLTVATKKKAWHIHKLSLTQYLQINIPHSLRQRLQELVLSDWRVYDTVTLRLLELFFSANTTSLKLIHVRTFYRDAFVNLLPQLTGLQQLRIQDPVWTFSRKQLVVTFLSISRMAHLRVLTLQYCGHDAILAAAGAHCSHLQVVDVRGSRSITDEGVWSLVTVRCDGEGRPMLPGDEMTKRKRAFRVGRCLRFAMKVISEKIELAFAEPRDPKLMKHLSCEGEGICWSRCSRALVHVDLRCTKVTPVGVTILGQAMSPRARIEHDNFHD